MIGSERKRNQCSLRATHLTNLLHEISYFRASPNTSWPDNHSIRYVYNFASCSYFSRYFFIGYFYDHWSCFHINTISLKLFFSKCGNSLVKPVTLAATESIRKQTEKEARALSNYTELNWKCEKSNVPYMFRIWLPASMRVIFT